MKSMQFNPKYSIILLLAVVQTAVAQKDDKDLGTEVVNVVKPYTATLSDAFKVKETPPLDDEETLKKEPIQYTIFSFPVASTFTPAKGKAEGVEKSKREKLFDNYATLGFGNYGTVIGELFVTENLSRNEYIGGMLRHHSSQGGIEGLDLDDKFSNTTLDLSYGSLGKDLSWSGDLGFEHQIYNWYGLPTYFTEGLTSEDKQLLVAGIDSQQTYYNFYIGGKIALSETFFKDATLKYNRFWDGYESAENRFVLKPSFDVAINDFDINTNVIVDYVGGTFKNGHNDATAIDYGFANIGINPSFVYTRDDLSMDIGVSLVYSAAQEVDSKLYVYPQITAAYKVVGDLMVFYAGAEGGLQQNSYRDFTTINPFLSPTLQIRPTDQQYDLFAGLKGKLANNISYNVRGSMLSEKYKPLFRSNYLELPVAIGANQSFAYGNSFTLVYDDVNTLSFFGEVNANLSKNFSFGFNGTFSTYTTDNESEAWNLPTIQLGGNMGVNFTEKWFAGVDLFLVGSRYDQYIVASALDPAFYEFKKVTLDSYFDLNANVGYRHNDRLTGFLRANNILNQSYEKWFNFPVQQFQIVLGANYKFDF
ncbi:TonB-dependent receptor [Flavobacterium sp.]|jgi:hypothetical protein|uniref:TonB-dependent receptor n=1 Tax=Flavobacterium sp. TaxID=239 RepID=UPI0037C07B05